MCPDRSDPMTSDSAISRHVSVLLIFVATFLVHGHVIDRFWLNDDPQVLLHAARHGAAEVLTDRNSWQELSGSNFTPLVTLSFDLDLTLFGLEPAMFYVHQLLGVAVAALMLRLLMLELGTGPRRALLLALLFVVAPPAIHVAGHLMTRHYVEGLILALVSVISWSRAAREGEARPWLIAVSCVAYLGALLAKEVFVLLPLVLLAFAIPVRSWRWVIAALAPFAAVLALYLGWRWWILESGGGYGERNLLTHFVSVTESWIDRDPSAALWISVALLIVVVTLRTAIGYARLALIATAVIAPLFGVGDALEPRHLLVPGVAALTGALFCIDRERNRRKRIVFMMVLLATAIVGAAAGIGRAVESTERMEAEGRYVWEKSSASPPLYATSPGWYLDGLIDLDRLLRSQSSPAVVYSRTGMVLENGDRRFITFDEDGTPRSVTPGEESMRRRYEPSAPIGLVIDRDGRALRWSFGPDCDCEWRFYSYPDYQMFAVPAEGTRIVPRPLERQWFRIGRYMSDGRWTLSPPLALPPDGEEVRWTREAERSSTKQSNLR